VTVKQRQEFRIRLQKRARRAAERKLDSFVEERNARVVRLYSCTGTAMTGTVRIP